MEKNTVQSWLAVQKKTKPPKQSNVLFLYWWPQWDQCSQSVLGAGNPQSKAINGVPVAALQGV
jgi:hypothetical protein